MFQYYIIDTFLIDLLSFEQIFDVVLAQGFKRATVNAMVAGLILI